MIHPAAELFPLMSETEYAALKEDIAANGLREPIWLHPDNRILDGRNRYRACQELGIKPTYRYWDGQGDPVSFSVSMNLQRRHLNESQRAMLAARLAQRAKGNRSIDLCGQAQAADLLNVSVPSLKRARVVQERGAPELVAAVQAGEIAVSAAATIAQAPPAEQVVIMAQGPRAIVEASKQVRAARAASRRQERVALAQELALHSAPLVATRRYPVIYADPPWRYEHCPTDSRQIENKYPTMALDEICALPVADLAAPHSVLFLWTTAPKLAEACRVLDAWGFSLRSNIVWDKVDMGMGYYARIQHELLLIAARGELPVPEPANRVRSVVRLPAGDHSEKPPYFRELIERMYPEYARIELFARQCTPGWDVWGNQANAPGS